MFRLLKLGYRAVTFPVRLALLPFKLVALLGKIAVVVLILLGIFILVF